MVLIVAIILQVIYLRFSIRYQVHKRRIFFNHWLPILVKVSIGEHLTLPGISSNDKNNFLSIWLHFQESLQGDARHYLNAAFYEVDLFPELKKSLAKGPLDERLIAVTAVGFLAEMKLWNEILALTHDSLPVLSITAARALVKIDSEKAAQVIFPIIAQRRDWPAAKLALILRESPNTFVDAFFVFVETTLCDQKPYLIRLLRLLDAQQINRSPLYIKNILEQSDAPELVAAGLKLVRDPKDLDIVRKLLNDDHWGVKIQAAAVLGRLGSPEDLPALITQLSSKNWWLRYRAARSIQMLPFLNDEDFDLIIKGQKDPYARDILEQVLSETEATK